MPVDEFGFRYETVGPAVPSAIAPTAPGDYEESGFLGELGKGIVRGFLNVGSGLVGTAEFIVPGQQESWIKARENIRSATSKFPFEDRSWEGWAGRVIGEAFPYMGASLVAGYAGAGIAGAVGGTAGLTGQAAAAGAGLTAKGIGVGAAFGAATVGFSVEGQMAYDEAISRGASENEANAERLIVGTVNAAIEATQVSRLMKFHSEGSLSLGQFIRNVRNRSWDLVGGDAKKFTGQVLRTALEESLEEALQEGVSISVPGFIRGDYPKNEDGTIAWSEVLQRIGGAALGGAVAGGFYGGAGAVIGAATEIGRPSTADIDSTIKIIQDYDIPETQKEQWINQLERLKTSFIEPKVEAPLDIGPGDNVYRGIETGKIYIEKAGAPTEQQTTRMESTPEGGTRIIAKDTGEELIQAADLMPSGITKPKPGIVSKWGTYNPYFEKNPYRKQIDEMEVTGQWDEDILKKASFWELEQVLKDKPAYLSDDSSYDEEVTAFADKHDLSYDFISLPWADPNYKALVVAKDEQSLQRFYKIKNQRDLGLALGYQDISSKLTVDKLPGYKKEYDEQLVNAISSINTELRAEHIAEIKKERGIRFNQAASRLAEENLNPSVKAMATFALVKSELEGEMGLRFEPIRFDENQINYYYQRVNIHPDVAADITVGLKATDGLNKLFGMEKGKEGLARLPEPNEIDALEKVFGARLAETLRKARTAGEKSALSKFKEVLNFPRALLASMDMSAGGRQGLLLLPIAPKQWLKSVWQGYRAWTSPEYTNFVELQIKSDPVYPVWKKYDGHFSELGSITSGEEFWTSRLAHKIPGIPASERAYTTTLNSLRFYTFKKFYEQWQGSGKSNADYKLLAGFINHATGRGDIKGLEKYVPFLNLAFFAPRLQMARVQSMADLFRGMTKKDMLFSPARKIIAADLIAAFAGGIGVLWLLSHMKGVEVEKDPRSSDFGKIRFGNTRIDFWGGYSQMARLLSQVVVAETKGTDSKRIMSAERGDIVWRYIQTKLSPVAGLSVDLLRGETFLGERLEVSPEVVNKQIYERFTPLFMQDTIDAMRYQGIVGASIVTPLAFHGIGAMTYPQRAGSEAVRIRDTISNQVFGKGWDELGDYGQQILRQARPEVEIAERQARIERENFDITAKRLEEQQRAMNRIVKELPLSVRNEIKENKAYLPGLSRYISNGWFLNDKRYKDYQSKTQIAMSLYLSKLVTLPGYKQAPPELKALMIEEFTNSIKESVRNKLLMDATIEDFQHLRERQP